MHSKTFFASLSVGLLAAASAFADDAPAPASEKTDSTATTPAASTDAPAPKDAPTALSPDKGGGEEREAANAVFLEGGGPGLFYSINFDRAFGEFSGRVGFSYIGVSASGPGGSSSASFMTVPITVSYLGIGSARNMFEVGAGATIIHAGAGATITNSSSGSASATLVWPTVSAGYRYQPEDGGFFFKVGMTGLIVGSEISIPVLPIPYLALGGTF